MRINRLTWGPGAPYARDPGGGNKTCTVVWAWEAPYAKESGKPTNMHIFVGPGGPVCQGPQECQQYIHIDVKPERFVPQGARVGTPYARDSGGSTICTHLCGAQTPVRQGPRVDNTERHLCGARGPLRQGNRGSQQYIHIYVGPGGPVCHGPGARTPGTPSGVKNYTHLCWVRGPTYAKDPRDVNNIQEGRGPAILHRASLWVGVCVCVCLQECV
jgi:hypothetical protein